MIDERETVGRYSSVENVDRTDTIHLLDVIWRWKVLIAAGVLFFLGTAFALLRLTPVHYEATKYLIIRQPGLEANGDQGRSTNSKILEMMPTWARIATSDEVLRDVKGRLSTGLTPDQLRNHISVRPVLNELSLQITARDSVPNTARRLAEAEGGAFTRYIQDFNASQSFPPGIQYDVQNVNVSKAQKPARNTIRTLVLTGALGFVVMCGIAFLLEYAERR